MSAVINPITSSAAQSSSAQNSLASTTALGGVAPTEDTFLQLLVSQLKNQDPLNPTDSTAFVGELAQFSSLEQLMQINQSTTNMATDLTSAQTSGTGTQTSTTTSTTTTPTDPTTGS